MTTPVHAVIALRWNYRWSGVWVWLKARRIQIPGHSVMGPGWWLVLRRPRLVVAYQLALAEGVIW
ncbi:MAG: hypothetical protein LC798_17040 [Chloroflexi bacterium]|nr:hypothetical protein [Chloroflexota bacterium]